MSAAESFVATREIKTAIEGRETDILDALHIEWRSTSRSRHIKCPYPDHGGDGLNWRWDGGKKKAFCSCQTGHADNALDVLMKCEGLDVEAGKIRAAEILGRHDLIKRKAKGGQKTDPASLLSPPAALQAPELPRAYLSSRLGIEPADVPMPDTCAIGWSALPYVEAVAKGVKTTFNEVAKPPCAVWETVTPDGRRHAHRIYTGEAGQGKADLGTTPDGRQRDPKKSASAPKDGPSTAGCSVLWGSLATAERAIVAEGIETACAVAYAYRAEIGAGTVLVAAAIAANGVAAWAPYPATKRITVAADRDEAVKPSRPTATRAGELAARRLGMAEHERGGVPVSIALPGERGRSVDWLDVLHADGVEAVRVGIESAKPFVPTVAELCDRAEKAGREAELERVAKAYPVPELSGRDLFYACTKAGRVWLHKRVKVGRGESAELVNVPISSPFAITARLKVMDDAEAYGLRLLLEDMGGQPRRVDIQRKTLATMGGTEARGLFLEAGVRFEDDGEQVAVAALKAAHPDAEINVVRHPGWHEVVGARVYVAPGGEVVGLPEGCTLELAAGAALSGSAAKGGTLEGWKAAAATAMAATGCPHFTLGLAAAFAGVLVDLCGLDSCGINLSGMTSAGKTTAQRLAASAWSVPDSTKSGLFQVAKTTANGFEALAERANGTVAALDELAHLTGKETARCIYTLASGVGKTRLTAGATVREPRHWRTFAILSSETGLEAKIRADGEAWTGGQAVRIADVDVTDVFRLLDRATFDTIASVGRHYGHAGPAFVRALVAAGTHDHAGDVRNGVNEMARRLAGKGADAATVRAALPLGILYMAGGMAQEYGLLPKGDAVRNAVLWAWGGFKVSSDAAALDPAVQAIGNIRQWIAERWRTSLHGIHAEERPARDAVGWWDDDCVYLTPDRLVEAAGGALKETQIAKALSEGRMLAKTKSDRNFAIFWVPRVGSLKAYALSRAHFGRGPEEEPKGSDGLKAYAGGRV